MQFIFKGTIEELKEKTKAVAKIMRKNIRLVHDSPDVLEIGFLRLTHTSGRFFVSNIREENGQIVLDGEFKKRDHQIPKQSAREFFKKLWGGFIALVAIYVFLALIPMAIWDIFNFPPSGTPFLIPLVIIAAFWLVSLIVDIKRRIGYGFKKEDEEFIRFMNIVTCDKSSTENVPETTDQLYRIITDTPDIHSMPELKDDVIKWNVYEDVLIKARVDEYDTIIELIGKNDLRDLDTHWHPEHDEIYDNLIELGKKGNVIVLKKRFENLDVLYIGDEENFNSQRTKKRNSVHLIYVKQK